MATLRIDTLDFHFLPEIDARKYDETAHYKQVVRQTGKRAVDIVAVPMGANPQRVWIVEAKDYRVLRGRPKHSSYIEMAEDFVRKVSDSLDGLVDAAAKAADAGERQYAARATSAQTRQAVLHLEPYDGPATRLFQGDDPASRVLMKLKQMLSHLDSPPLVLNIASTRRANVPWTVS
jgi:hypothetical protein